MTQTAMRTETPTIVIFEREPYWEPELRRQFRGDDLAIRACRTVGDLDESIRLRTNAVAIVSLGDAAADLLRWLSKHLIGGRCVPTIVIVSNAMRSLEWHALEAGAVAVVDESIGGHRLARLLRKQWPHLIPAATQGIRKTS